MDIRILLKADRTQKTLMNKMIEKERVFNLSNTAI